MTDLFLLSRVQMRVGLNGIFHFRMGLRGWTIGGSSARSSLASRTGCVGATLRATTAHTRRSTIGSFAGAAWACSTRARRTGGQGRQTGADHDRRHASKGASHSASLL